MRIIYNAFNTRNYSQHVVGNINIIMNKVESFDEVSFEYNLKNGYVFIDHVIEDGKRKSYLYKYCYFDKQSVYGEEVREKPIMLTPYIENDNGKRISELENKFEIKYLQEDDILYIAFLYNFGKKPVIDDLIKNSYEKALKLIIDYVKENSSIMQKITDIYINENRVYFIYEKIYDHVCNDEELDYQVKLIGYTTNKQLADEIEVNAYISGRDVIVTDEMPKIQNLAIKRPEYAYVEVYYEEDKVKEISGLKKSSYFSFKFIDKEDREYIQLFNKFMIDHPLAPKIPDVLYEKDNGHFYFKCKTTKKMNKQEFSQHVQDLAINYIIFRQKYEM